MDATHQLVCARLGDSASTALKLFVFSLCSALLMSTKSKPQTPPPPRELFRFGQGFLNLRSDLVVASPLYDNPTLLLLTKQSETRHISPSQPLDALSGWMLRLYDVLYCLNQEDTKISHCSSLGAVATVEPPANEHINLGRV